MTEPCCYDRYDFRELTYLYLLINILCMNLVPDVAAFARDCRDDGDITVKNAGLRQCVPVQNGVISKATSPRNHTASQRDQSQRRRNLMKFK